MSDYEIKAIWDEKGSIGADRDHYVFPAIAKTMDRCAAAIAGGVYIQKGFDVPERIIITIDRR